MEIKIGKKYKANAIFKKQYSLRGDYVRLSSIGNGLATIVCEGKVTPVRMDFFLSNIVDLSKAVESIPRSVEEWKNEQKDKVIPQEVVKVEPEIIPEPKQEIPIPVPEEEPIIPETVDPESENKETEPEDEPEVVKEEDKPVEPEPIPEQDPEPEPEPEPEPPVEDDPWADDYPYGGNEYPY